MEERISAVLHASHGGLTTQIDQSVTNRAGTKNADSMANLFSPQSFHDFVMNGYQYHCAITGNVVRYGNYMNLEAAHIWPRSHSGLFLPSNGIALCRDMHFSFDKGFFTITDDCRVKVHPAIDSDWLKKYDGKQIFVPQDAFFQPDVNSLHYHQNHIYGLFLTSGSLINASGYTGYTGRHP